MIGASLFIKDAHSQKKKKKNEYPAEAIRESQQK
jgi:hypothetical protein